MASNILRSLAHPSELVALLSFAWETARKKDYFTKQNTLKRDKNHPVDRSNTHAECYHFLNLTSRSFAAVVQALDAELRDPVCFIHDMQ
jgi:farnesyl-diphosphate farnesyltransferase